MASPRFAWGIDVGNRALKAVKLVREGDQLRVDDFELIEHEHVLSNAGDNKDALIQAALTSFVQRHPMKSGGAVAIGVSGQSSFARFVKLPPVEPKKIPEIVRFEALQQIPFPLDEVEWAYQLFQSPESPDTEVGIFAMRKELVSRQVQLYTDLDLNVQVVQMNPLAVYNAVIYDQRVKGTTMLIDLGAENTDLIICDEDTVWMRSIPIGGNNFTETLVKAFRLPFAKAEDLKRNAATSKYARQIFQAMRPVFADLVAEIQRSVGFYASVHRDSRIKKIIALGGTFRLPGLQKYLQQNLSLDVERLDTVAGGAPPDPKQAATFNENILSVISAYGLAVQAMGDAKITSSLLPEAIRREKLWRAKTPIFATAAALFCVGTGVALAGYFLQDFKFQSAQKEREQNTQIKAQAATLDSEWSAIESSGTSERALISNVMGLAQGRDLWRNLLNDIKSAVPKPQPPVAKGLLDSNADLIKQIKRDQREQIVIESITSRYVPTMGSIVSGSDADFKASANGDAIAAGGLPGALLPPGVTAAAAPAVAGAAPEPRGFILTIRGTSPYANTSSFIETKFLDALKNIKAPPDGSGNHPYAVIKAITVTADQLKENPARLAALKTQYDQILTARTLATQAAMSDTASPEVGAPPPPPPAIGDATAQAGEDITPYLDRLTGEDMRNDWEFTLLIAVELDVVPAPAAPPTGPQAMAQ